MYAMLFVAAVVGVAFWVILDALPKLMADAKATREAVEEQPTPPRNEIPIKGILFTEFLRQFGTPTLVADVAGMKIAFWNAHGMFAFDPATNRCEGPVENPEVVFDHLKSG
jgi:hypothetical protein